MKLDNTIMVERPDIIHHKSGTIFPQPPLILEELTFTIMDNYSQKRVLAIIPGFPTGIVLWQGIEYDSAGDYTQAQAEARLLEKLGPDLKAGLENLFPKPAAQ